MAQKPQESELKRLNLENLRKQEDKSIKDILGNASHTTLYRFDNTTCQWDRVGVEGTAFIVVAEKSPFSRLIVLNKLDVNNFTLDLSQVNKVKLQPPYLMIRLHSDSKHKIMGLWFHHEDERATMKEAMEKAISLIPAGGNSAQPSKQKSGSSASAQKSSTPTKNSSSDSPKVEEFSMEAMSQNSSIFHSETHKNGAPIELDSSLPNNFVKIDKESSSPPDPNSGSGSGGRSGAKNKGLALLNSIRSSPVGSNDDVMTDYAITSTRRKQTQYDSNLKNEYVPPGTPPESGMILYAPSDITHCRRRFIKQF